MCLKTSVLTNMWMPWTNKKFLTAFFLISLHFFCISLHSLTFRCISLHFTAFICISLHYFAFYILYFRAIWRSIPSFYMDAIFLFSLSFYQIRKLRIFIFILISRPVCQFIQTFTIFATACYCLSKRISMEIKIGNRPNATFPMTSSSSSSFSVWLWLEMMMLIMSLVFQ